MNSLILDVETTISNNGNSFDTKNKLVCVGLKSQKGTQIIYDWEQYWDRIKWGIENFNLIIAFNAKFDLHWIRKIGINFDNKSIWDCQLAEFLLNFQKTPYPSLDDAAIKYGFPPKIDNIKLNYWDKGIDTDQIPREELSEYLCRDLELTQQVYERQVEEFKKYPQLFKLFRLQCADLLVLEEIEWNGIKFNKIKARERAQELQDELTRIHNRISSLIDNIPFNPNSNDHISAILYGGRIVESIRIPVGTFKTGNKIGQIRYKIVDKEYNLDRLVEPLKGTEVKKPEGGIQSWKVNDTILRSLKLSKKAKEIVNLFTEYSKIEKLRGTYLIGYSDLIESMNWQNDILHPTLNQCVAATGRLTSTKPNGQNADPETKLYMESRNES